MRFIIILVCFGALFILIALLARVSQTSAFDSETLSVFANDCTTPKAVFYPGDTVCALSTGAPLSQSVQRRFEWVAPNGTIFQLGPDIISDPQNNAITIPSTGHLAQAGIWVVKTVDNSNNGFAVAQFAVQNPDSTAADLSLSMSGPFMASAGGQANFTLFVKNNGPNEAQNVQLTVAGTSNATFLTENQIAGANFTCANPAGGGNGASTCSIAVLPVNASASFVFIYQIGSDAPKGTIISNTATLTSTTAELFSPDNTATAIALTAAQPCSISCPGNITVQKQQGQCGAAVNYTIPAGAGKECGKPFCNPPTGSFFPVGTTIVVCAGDTGVPCNFTVTVDGQQSPSITCPADITRNESSRGFGLATVNYKLPTRSDSCTAQTTDCTPPSGSTFAVGTTVVNCEVSDAAGNASTCNFNVTVNSSDCSLSAVNLVKANDPDVCGALVIYPLPTSSGDCGTVSCSPPSNSFFPTGSTAVSCTSSNGADCLFNITVEDRQAPAITNASATPSSLLPATRKMKEVTVNYQTSDNCAGEMVCTLSVNSNDSVKDAGSGKKIADWEIVDAHHLKLRAERLRDGKPRVYTVTITCTDLTGNSSSKTVTVSVPQNQ